MRGKKYKKTIKKFLIYFVILLIISISFVSAGWFSDFWNKITGNTITGNTITGKAIITSGLIAEYKFNGNTQDSSGNNNHGTSSGNLIFVAGKSGNALSFDGDDYISLPNIITSSSGTISLWVKTPININNTIFDASSGSKYFFIDFSQYKSLRFNLEDSNDNDFTNANYGISSYDLTQWHYITAVWNYDSPPVAKIYIDGILVNQDTRSAADLPVLSSSPNIGKYKVMFQTQWYFTGEIDEVMIFNRALTPEEILDLYNSYSGITPTCGDGSCNGGETTASCPRDCPAATYECSDSIDNDNDFLIDYGTSPTNDPGCSSSNDNNETDTIISGDTITPSTPANLSAIALSSSQVYLSWGASTDNIGIGGYKIYKNNIQVGASITTFYTDTNLQAETTYTYAVSAYDTSGNEGNKSNSVNATTQTQSLNASDTTPPARSNQQPFGSLALGTKQTIISLATDESATCKYSTTPNTDYNSMPYLFSTTGGMVHSQLIQGLSDGNSYNYYIRCNDVWGNFNTDDFSISFSVNTSSAVTSCTLTNASWSKTSATEGDTITLTVTGNNCDREQVNFEVLEDDLLSRGDSVVTPPANAVFSGNTATTIWTAEYQVDGIFGINDPPEYYSIASLNSDSNVNLNSKSNALLEVNQYLHLCLEKGGQVCLSSQTCDGTITDVNEKNQCCIGDCLNTTKSSGVYRSFSSEKVDGDEIFTVNIDVSINKNEKYYVIDETIPNNFSIINPGIGNTQKEGHITWVVIKNANSATYNYSVKAPSPTQKTTYSFNGIYLFENMSSVGTITGSRDIIVS